jgi:hypothetical protein
MNMDQVEEQRNRVHVSEGLQDSYDYQERMRLCLTLTGHCDLPLPEANDEDWHQNIAQSAPCLVAKLSLFRKVVPAQEFFHFQSNVHAHEQPKRPSLSRVQVANELARVLVNQGLALSQIDLLPTLMMTVLQRRYHERSLLQEKMKMHESYSDRDQTAASLVLSLLCLGLMQR